MENKCNKTPNNCKYMDHVYCHTSESKNYIRSNNNNASSMSAGSALLKENKQLKAMLILHLDLIQEQSDQLMAKDKQLAQQTDEIAQQRIEIQELQRQLQRHFKRAAAAAGELSTLPPPLAKIQCHQAEPNATQKTNIIGECNGKIISKIILQRVDASEREDTHSPNSTTVSESASEADGSVAIDDEEHDEFGSEQYEIDDADHIELDEDDGLEEDEEGIKMELTIEDTESTEDSNDAVLSTLSRGAKPLQTLPNKPEVCSVPPTPPSRGKQMPLMLWHAPEMQTDESGSCDSQADADTVDQHSTNTPSMDSPKKTHTNPSLPTTPHAIQNTKSKRCAYISTSQLYSTREWVDDEFHYDYEFIKEEANALHDDAPMLEIPKWTEHDELTPSYCMEGTEDLSDETFLKRHFKLEVDEKRRKKWDVQQIREQRRVEKLKKRHCKNEVQTMSEQALVSFYPQTETLEAICFVHDLPVQAFGEMIPKLNVTAGEFILPWLTTSQSHGSNTTAICAANTTKTAVATLSSDNLSATSAQVQQQIMNSSFVFLKKRRRMQSVSNAPATPQSATTRQRVAKAAMQSVPHQTLVTEATK